MGKEEEKMKNAKYEIPRKWRGVISCNRRLTKQAVICLFEDSWRASATDGHTHDANYLHFRRNTLTREKLEMAGEYFKLIQEQEKHDTGTDEYFAIEEEIQEIRKMLQEK